MKLNYSLTYVNSYGDVLNYFDECENVEDCIRDFRSTYPEKEYKIIDVTLIRKQIITYLNKFDMNESGYVNAERELKKVKDTTKTNYRSYLADDREYVYRVMQIDSTGKATLIKKYTNKRSAINKKRECESLYPYDTFDIWECEVKK